jgi:hypothetical protein
VAGPGDDWLAINAPGRPWSEDAEGDGWTHLHEYALGGSPVTHDKGITRVGSDAQGRLALTFEYNTAAVDTQIEVQASDSLGGWTTILTKPAGATDSWSGPAGFLRGAKLNGIEMLTVTDLEAVQQARFMRLRLTR